MGYMLNSLTNLPIDVDVKFYIFIINGQYQDPLYTVLQQNFSSVARSIGHDAVIATGLNPQEWYGEIASRYLGSDHGKLFELLPAVLITDSHPNKISDSTLRLLIPLRDVESRFGGWPQFFALMSDFVRGRSDEFVTKFQPKEDIIDKANKVVNLRPGMFGISINLNELIIIWRKKRKAAAP